MLCIAKLEAKMETKVVTFTVENSFQVPVLFQTITPKETGILLNVSSSIHHFLKNEQKSLNEKLLESEMLGVQKTLKHLLHEVKDSEKLNYEKEIEELKKVVLDLNSKNKDLLIVSESKQIKLDFLKKSTIENSTKEELDCKHSERVGYQKGYDECQKNNIEKLTELKHKNSVIEAKNCVITECQNKIQSLQNEMLKLESSKNEHILKLKDENAKLNTPMGKGESGEYVVEETLKNERFHVFDTSKSPFKDDGYLDRIITEDGNFPNTNGWSIGIEIKNKKRIVKSTDIDSFKQKSEEGIHSGRFNATLLLSIDDIIGKESSSIEFVYDDTGIPIGVIGIYSPCSSTNMLTQEQVVMCVYHHINLIKQCKHITTILANQGAKDEDINKVQHFFKRYVKDTRENFEDLSELTKTVSKLQSMLEVKKRRFFEQFKSLEDIDKKISWLNTNFSIPLNVCYENAKNKFDTNKNMTKSQVFQKVGNIPLLNNQLGLDNAWTIIKKQSITNMDEECKFSDSADETPCVENFETDTDLDKVVQQVEEHILRKQKNKPDYNINTVTSATLALNLRESVRKVGGLDIIKRKFEQRANDSCNSDNDTSKRQKN